MSQQNGGLSVSYCWGNGELRINQNSTVYKGHALSSFERPRWCFGNVCEVQILRHIYSSFQASHIVFVLSVLKSLWGVGYSNSFNGFVLFFDLQSWGLHIRCGHELGKINVSYKVLVMKRWYRARSKHGRNVMQFMRCDGLCRWIYASWKKKWKKTASARPRWLRYGWSESIVFKPMLDIHGFSALWSSHAGWLSWLEVWKLCILWA